jgi:hypothetical protein
MDAISTKRLPETCVDRYWLENFLLHRIGYSTEDMTNMEYIDYQLIVQLAWNDWIRDQNSVRMGI